jgi:uncharacterized protein (DUF1697 family)
MIKFVALLRGINVGGHKKVKMEDLRRLFESFGFKNVKTYIASGNVLFETEETDIPNLRKKIEKKLMQAFGFKVAVILRTIPEIKELIILNPFKNIKVDENVRLYVTFLAEKPKSGLKLPYESPGKDFRILQKTNGEIFSVLYVLPTARTVDLMTLIEKEFGKVSTTRNWNTVQKIAAI